MERIILGNGISGYIVAATLKYLGYYPIIYGYGKYTPPEILLLECANENEAIDFLKILGLKKEYYKYIKKINIGFLNAFDKVLASPTKDMVIDYYTKQNRKITSTGMSNGKSSYIAIDLKLLYDEFLFSTYKSIVIEKKITPSLIKKLKNIKHSVIYNTVYDTHYSKEKPNYEYIVKRNNFFKKINDEKYDYIYDCIPTSNVKRITKNVIEAFKEPLDKEFIKIKNYYKTPEIHTIVNLALDNYWIDISRNTTHSQLKQKDIIEYLLSDKNA